MSMGLQTLMKRIDIVVASVAVVVLVLRAIFCGYVFSQQLLSDEIYYVTSAKYVLYLIGFIGDFTSPTAQHNVSFTVETVNGTVRMHFTVNLTEPAGWIRLFPYVPEQSTDWLGAGHPIFAKLVYGVLVQTFGTVGGRLALLVLSAVSAFLFLRETVKRYKLYTVPAVALFVLLSGTYVHLMYLYFLDTLMIAFMLLAAWSVMRGKHSEAAAFMALAVASKEAALLYLVPLIGFELARRSRKVVALYIFGAIVGIATGYAPYLLFVSPDTVVRNVAAMVEIKDPYACRALCLLDGIEARWSLFKIYVVLFLWIWFAVPLLIKYAEKDVVPLYFTGLFVLLAYTLLGFRRSVYVYYYGYFEPLSVLPIALGTALIFRLLLRVEQHITPLAQS